MSRSNRNRVARRAALALTMIGALAATGCSGGHRITGDSVETMEPITLRYGDYTTVSSAGSSTQASACETSGGATLRWRPKPEAVGIRPASTAGSAGSSTCTTRREIPATRRRTSATWAATPSASACASSRRAPWSARSSIRRMALSGRRWMARSSPVLCPCARR